MKYTEKIKAPIRVLHREKTYLFWLIFVAVFGLINVWAGLLMGEYCIVMDAFEEGIVYTFSISLSAPFCTDVFVEMLVDKRERKTSMFVSYKVITVLLNVIWIVILCLLWLGKYKGDFIIQIIIGIISLFFSFYMYCIGKMERHKDITQVFDDMEYLSEENDRMDDLENRAGSTDLIETDKGDIKL